MEALCNNENSTNQCDNKSPKDYQAQLTLLKKQAKNNKKNKKELLLEIAKLEKEFQEASFEDKEISNNADCKDINSEPQNTNQRVSKAQKRRDKKVLNERERAQRIEEQEELNKQGSRHKETLSIKTLLKRRNLSICDIPSNGDCLYKAIEHQLTINDRNRLSGNELRKLASDYLRKHMMEFLPFMSNPESGDLLTDSEFEDYCSKIENTNVWGGQIELQAISCALQTTIEVLQAEGPPAVQGAEYKTKPLVLTYHRHIFGLGEHYNSTQPCNDESEDSN